MATLLFRNTVINFENIYLMDSPKDFVIWYTGLELSLKTAHSLFNYSSEGIPSSAKTLHREVEKHDTEIWTHIGLVKDAF